MSIQKKPINKKKIRANIAKELNFIKNIFTMVSIPTHTKAEEDQDFEMVNGQQPENTETMQTQRMSTITELKAKLEEKKGPNKFNLKDKLMKKSLASKLNKKLKKKERQNKNKVKIVKPNPQVNQEEEKPNVNVAKPVFNTDGKLVFSKFDFANVGQKPKVIKKEKNPKKILEQIEEQNTKLKKMEEEGTEKVKEIKEKMAWKNILQKAEGQKIKDDPVLLKKSIKKMEQKKKQSKKQWDGRLKNLEQKKEDKQKKRQENIMKKKKEKKTKIHKTAAKRGRVVL